MYVCTCITILCYSSVIIALILRRDGHDNNKVKFERLTVQVVLRNNLKKKGKRTELI